jgi:diguanylate cyclase (GGDEF)-like protein
MPIWREAKTKMMQFIGDSSMSPTGHAENLLPLFEAGQAEPFNAHTSQLLQLTNRLQASLDVKDIINSFSEDVQAMVSHDYIQYQHGKQEIDITLGKKARHCLNYQLTVNQKPLGTLAISRRSKFSEEESQQLEDLLCILLYPLRNALLYHSAVAAARKDTLTGVANRAAFDDSLVREIDVARRHQRELGIIVIDIDHFKHANDTYGHATGDCLLQALSHCADQTIRSSDMLFRYGGEEFVAILPSTTEKGAKLLAERVRRNIESLECFCEGHAIKLTASLGVTTLRDGDTADSFFRRADEALYRAKSQGRNQTCVAE